MRVRITKVPSKNKLEKAAYGGQTATGALNVNPTSYFGGGRDKSNLSQARTGKTLTSIPRDKANLEAEGGETAFGPISGESIPDHYTIKGPRHSNGGVPLDLPDDTFIFSDTKSMKITDPRILKMFGKKAKKGGYTPAELAKPYDINKYKSILMDPDSDRKERETATLMIKNFIIKLGALALAQESKKGFPQGIPEMAKPYMESIGLKEEDILPQEQEMQPEQMMAMQQQGPPPAAPPGAMDPNQMEEVLQQEQQMMPPQMEQPMPMARYGGTPMAAYGMQLGGYDMPFIMANGGYADMLPSYQGDEGGSEVSSEGGMCRVKIDFGGKQNPDEGGGTAISDFDQGTRGYVTMPCSKARELKAAQKQYYEEKQKLLDAEFDVKKGILDPATGDYIPFTRNQRRRDQARVTAGGKQTGNYLDHGWGDPAGNLGNSFSVDQVNAIAPDFYDSLKSLATLHKEYVPDQKIPDLRGESEIANDPDGNTITSLENAFGPRQFSLNYEMGEIEDNECVCKHPQTGEVLHTWPKPADGDCSSEGQPKCVVQEDENVEILEDEIQEEGETPQYSDAALRNMIAQKTYDTSVDYMTSQRIDPKMGRPALQERYDADIFSALANQNLAINQGPGSASQKLIQSLSMMDKGLNATGGRNKATTDYNINVLNTEGARNRAREQQAAAQNAQLQFKTDAYNIGQGEKQRIAQNVVRQAQGLALADAEKELTQKLMWNYQNPNFPIGYKKGDPGFIPSYKVNPYKTKGDQDILNECMRTYGAETQAYKDCVKMKMDARNPKNKNKTTNTNTTTANQQQPLLRNGGYVLASMMYPFNNY